MVKRINLALQGGGAHGAFTWGVLDRLLEDEEIEIAAISGTSAGALNGAALKAGLLAGGRQGARDNLDWLWEQVGGIGDLRLANWLTEFTPGSGTVSRLIEYSLPYSLTDTATRMISPYSYGPFYKNPLEKVVAQLDYDKVCHHASPTFFVGATNVRTGKVRVFTHDEITTEAILASACLPEIFQAVEIPDPLTGEIEAYWDGGYAANPALFPLLAPDLPDDIVIVNINPLERPDVPVSALEIQNRINEISFNSALLGELRAMRLIKQLVQGGQLERGTMKEVLVHMIADDSVMRELSLATKRVASPVILMRLKAAGRAAADRFIEEAKPSLNVEDTLDLYRICD